MHARQLSVEERGHDRVSQRGPAAADGGQRRLLEDEAQIPLRHDPSRLVKGSRRSLLSKANLLPLQASSGEIGNFKVLAERHSRRAGEASFWPWG
jgi:hypothetical protein